MLTTVLRNHCHAFSDIKSKLVIVKRNKMKLAILDIFKITNTLNKLITDARDVYKNRIYVYYCKISFNPQIKKTNKHIDRKILLCFRCNHIYVYIFKYINYK